MISEPIRKMTQFHWISLFICIFLAWIFLYFFSVPNELRLLSKIYGANFLNEFCIITPDLGGFFQILCKKVTNTRKKKHEKIYLCVVHAFRASNPER